MLDWRVVAGSREYWRVVGGCMGLRCGFGVLGGVVGDYGVFWLFWAVFGGNG